MATSGPTVRRIAYDETRQTMFVTRGTDPGGVPSERGLSAMSVSTGALTPVGAALADNQYPGAHFVGLLSVPRPACP